MDEQTKIAVREERYLAESIEQLEGSFALAVRQRELLEGYIKDRLHPGKHFYKMSGDQKPSLTKEGAELICLPHRLRPKYEIISGPEQPPDDWKPYQVTVKCALIERGQDSGEGIGSASSHVTKRTGERQPRQKDIGLCHNATLKMAQKSAYIAATLNATAASEFFTQDMEDTSDTTPQAEAASGFYCQEHKTEWFKRGKMRGYAHKVGDTGWCNMPTTSPERPLEAPEEAGVAPDKGDLRGDLLKEIAYYKSQLGWTPQQFEEEIKGEMPGLAMYITDKGLATSKMEMSQVEALGNFLHLRLGAVQGPVDEVEV